MKSGPLAFFVIAPLLYGCTYSSKGPIAAPAAFVHPVEPEHQLRHAISLEDVTGVEEAARHIGVFKIVSEKEVIEALRKNLQNHGLSAAPDEAARYALKVSFTDISASLRIGFSQPATASLSYELIDTQNQDVIKRGLIKGEGNATGIQDASVRSPESARCAVRNALYKLTLTLRDDQPIPQSGLLDGGCRFATHSR